MVTDKQFGSMELFYEKKPKKVPEQYVQLLLFDMDWLFQARTESDFTGFILKNPAVGPDFLILANVV